MATKKNDKAMANAIADDNKYFSKKKPDRNTPDEPINNKGLLPSKRATAKKKK